MGKRWPYVVLLAIFAICLTPVAAVAWASAFARRHGCTLHEGFTNPCIVDGQDWGETLYTAFASGWFMLATLPVAALCLLAMLVLGVIDVIRARRRRG